MKKRLLIRLGMAQPKKERLGGQATVLHTVIRFLADLHSKSPDFRDFAVSSDYIRLLLAVLFPSGCKHRLGQPGCGAKFSRLGTDI